MMNLASSGSRRRRPLGWTTSQAEGSGRSLGPDLGPAGPVRAAAVIVGDQERFLQRA